MQNYVFNNVLDMIEGMNFDEIEKFHKNSPYNIKKFICYHKYQGNIRNILIYESCNINKREEVEIFYAIKLKAEYFTSAKYRIFAKYDWKEVLNNGNFYIT